MTKCARLNSNDCNTEDAQSSKILGATTHTEIKLTLYLFTVLNVCTPVAGLTFNIKSETGGALDGRQSSDTIFTCVIAPNCSIVVFGGRGSFGYL